MPIKSLDERRKRYANRTPEKKESDRVYLAARRAHMQKILDFGKEKIAEKLVEA